MREFQKPTRSEKYMVSAGPFDTFIFRVSWNEPLCEHYRRLNRLLRTRNILQYAIAVWLSCEFILHLHPVEIGSADIPTHPAEIAKYYNDLS